jgi:hypothetical protein
MIKSDFDMQAEALSYQVERLHPDVMVGDLLLPGNVRVLGLLPPLEEDCCEWRAAASSSHHGGGLL